MEEVRARLLFFLIRGLGEGDLAEKGSPWEASCPWRPLGF